MPSQVFRGSGNQPTAQLTETFTGTVYFEKIHSDPSNVTPATIANVTFAPCARTHWHTHEHGQMLKVLQGSGWVCDAGATPQRIVAGDVIWAAAGTTHWHGADDDSIMTHLVIGLGKTTWREAVTDEEYGMKGGGAT